MTQSRSLSEKFPSYRQEACTTENVIQCLSEREEKERKGWGWKKEHMRIRGKNKLEEHIQRTKEDHQEKELEIWLYKQNQTP